jgi:hypothetical protein
MSTTRLQPSFRVRLYPSGQPYIEIEPRGVPEAGFPAGAFGFDLPIGTTSEAAQQLASQLDAMLVQFAHTPPVAAPAPA